jgi:hypothetical protein
MDWNGWARRAEAALDVGGRGDWYGLFAPGATFADPATTDPTTDLREISHGTKRLFPDWRQQITSIRGGDEWAVFEWTGYGTYSPGADQPGHGAPIEMHGATIVEIDGTGLVTSWRDYLDRKEPESQIRRAVRKA